MPLHRPLAQAIVEALQQIFGQRHYAESVVANLLSTHTRWGSRDRRFVAEAIYEIVRHPHFAANKALWKNDKKNAVPTDQQWAWHLLGAWLITNNQSLPDWEEFSKIDPQEIQQHHQEAQNHRITRHAIPSWLDELAVQELGETGWENELTALDQVAPVFIRVNTLKTTPAQLITALAKADIKATAVPNMPEALRIEGRKNLTATDNYRKGHFEVQDAGSQHIAPFCDVQSGMVVIDACAGAGGKSLHLATLMKNKGNIVAMDTDKKKLALLEQRAQRAGITIIRTRHINNPKVIDRYRFSADRLLLDVPCSGIGTMRRQPDLKWQLSPEKIAALHIQQADILDRYSTMLHPDGKLVYATCSILPSENDHPIAVFVNNSKQKNLEGIANQPFTLLQQHHVSPLQTGFDGFYMACLAKVKSEK